MISARSDTWICYVYVLDLSFQEVACVYFVAMATNTVETAFFAVGRMLVFTHSEIMKLVL